MNNNVLDGRDWKYKIAFDNDTYKDIVRHTFSYEPKERDILNVQIDFYRKHFTFQQLLKSFRMLNTEEEIAEFKSASYKRKENILYCPKELKQYYLDLINKNYKEHSEFLTEMLLFACKKSGRTNPLMKVYKTIFGVYFKPMKKKLKQYSQRQLRNYNPTFVNNETEIKKIVKGTVNKVQTDPLSLGIWGDSEFGDIRYELSPDVGSGKVVSKQFYMGSRDTYIIQTNENRITNYQLVYGVYRNIYPGRAHLFNTLIPDRVYNFDSGADYIVNGWSTFSAWHIYPSEYTRYMKVLNGKIAHEMITGNWQRSITNIYFLLLNSMSKDEVLKYIIEITQYPGRFESYVMGAIVTELLITKKFATSPMGLLDEYKKRNVADLFALFKPNTNKC